jgi:hypothetical protein
MLGRERVMHEGDSMATYWGVKNATTAILTLADIKAAADAFEQGEVSVFDTLDTIAMAIEGYQATAREATAQPRRNAA